MEHCKLCDDSTDTLVKQIEASVIDMIRKHNPDWIEADGSCRKCLVHYRNLDQLIEQDD